MRLLQSGRKPRAAPHCSDVCLSKLRLFMASNFYSKQRPVVQQKHKSRTARPPQAVYGPGDCLPSINSATVGEFNEELPVSPCIIKFFLNSRP